MRTLDKIEEKFETHLKSVDELISFDRIILDFCINHLEILNENLKAGPFNITNPTYLAESSLKAVKNVRQNDSLRINYLSMFNSCLVLQVSYFTSIVEDIFNHTTICIFPEGHDFYNLSTKKKNDINFQNMWSTVKSFKNYLNFIVEENSIFNTILLAQSCRHAIVHSNSIADKKFINQISNAKPREIKKELQINDKIQFSSSELELVKLAMQEFIGNLCTKMKKTYKIE